MLRALSARRLHSTVPPARAGPFHRMAPTAAAPPKAVHPHPDVAEVLITAEAIAERIAVLGRTISEEYADKRPIFVVTLKGAATFACDLLRAVDPVPAGLEVEYVRASSYGGGTASSGAVALAASTLAEGALAGRHVIVVEDIVDSGRTAAALAAHVAAAGAASVELAALLSKPSRRAVPFEAKFTGFAIEDEFVVGYGLDFAEALRSLPYVGILRPELYQDSEQLGV